MCSLLVDWICELENFLYSEMESYKNFVNVCFLLCGILLCKFVVQYITNLISDYKERGRLKELVRKKKVEREEALVRLKSQHRLDEDAKLIVDLPVDRLMQKLQDRSISAHCVMSAFIAKAIQVTESFNCVTEFIPQSMEWAMALDDLPKIKGPLHGLPICIKEDTDVEGMDSTLGFAKLLYQPARESATIVKVLMDLGAVPFCKTNVPQGLASFGSDNPIFGQTTNCLNVKLTPGGSSSGSGCMVAAGGSPVGTGTDVAGSLRIPAHFNGICSICPTTRRLSDKGIVQSSPKCIGLKAVPGIMARDATTVANVFKALVSKQSNYDPQIVPLPWNKDLYESKCKIRVGFFTNLKIFPCMGDTEDTIQKAKGILESLGHELVPFSLPNDFHMFKTGLDLFFADFGHHSNLKKMLHNEMRAQCIGSTAALCGMSYWRRKLVQVLGKVPFLSFSSSRIRLILGISLEVQQSYQLWNCMHQRNLIREEILKTMHELQVDLILCPVFPFPACRLSDPDKLGVALAYTFVWNLVDFPVGVVKCGKESGKHFDKYDDQKDTILKLAKDGLADAKGMPIGVQLVGLPYKEELVLRVMRELDQTSI